MKEKRKHARIPVTARVSMVERGKKDFYFTKDLSVGGIFLLTEEDIPIGTNLDLEIAVQGMKDLIKLKGKVVRAEREGEKLVGFGVQFVDVARDDSKKLKKLLDDSR